MQESINDRDRTVISRKIEALLFASDTPLSASRLASLVGIESTKLIKSEIESLDRFYREQSRSFEIVEVAGGYQITTLPEFSSIISQLFKKKRKTRLSQPALETLAIVAYKQPINRMAIEAIRGVNCDGVLATLIERELIAVTGRGDGVGRPYLYSTTRMFLEYLGLKDYSDLPKIEELERKPEIADLIPKIPGSEDEDSSEDGSQFQGEASGGKEGDIGRLNEG